ncbi:uncharacterized protein isoform X1 [Musca autumnalis]|uniref:uncharacterized protein isoform X1 n=1 Tax=Musca autumnalis TaxID=221902 RepID=UPI003CEFDCBB
MDKDLFLHILDDSSSEDEFVFEESEDEELLENLVLSVKGRRNSIINYSTSVITKYTEEEFKMHFRISRTMFNTLCSMFADSEYYKNLRADKRMSSEDHLAIFLWFAGHEASCFRDISDRFNVTISTVSRTITRVTNFLSRLSPQVIKWPTDEEKAASSQFFKARCGFAGAIGLHLNVHIWSHCGKFTGTIQ